MVYGYARVSTINQKEGRQVEVLLKCGIKKENIFVDKESGKNFKRSEYRKLYAKLKKDDLVVVKSIDRLGRNYNEILEEWRKIVKKKKTDIVVCDMPLLNTTHAKDTLGTFISDLVLQLLSFVAENERTNILQRQAEGIACAKKRGVKFGRPAIHIPKNYEENYRLWKEKKITAQEGADNCGMKLWEFYKYGNRIT